MNIFFNLNSLKEINGVIARLAEYYLLSSVIQQINFLT